MRYVPQWLQKALDKVASLRQEALDKLPQDELDGVMPGMNSGPPPDQPPQPMDIPMPMPEPEADVSGNVFEVDVNGVKVKMKLVPELVMKEQTPPPMPQAPASDPMSDTSLNPNADPQALAKWMTDPSTEKPFGNNEQGTIDPLSQQEEGIPVHDTGSENELAQQQEPKVNVHKKPRKTAAVAPTPGADRSNPSYPCAVCANYDAANGKCSQGIDTEKVQAAGSCSWLNSNFKPLDGDGVMPSQDKDKETYVNDVSDLPSSGGAGVTKGASLKNVWKKL